MGKIFEKNLTIILLAIISYFLFSISSSLKESAKYHSDLKMCAKMKAYSNNKESSIFYKKLATDQIGVELDFIGEYCKKLIQQNMF